MPVAVKICGVRTMEALQAAISGGARAVGLNFYAPSPRAIAADQATQLARMLPTGIRAVGLFVDAGDEELQSFTSRVPLDLIQLHGKETPRRVAEIRSRFALPVMKVIGVATKDDLAQLADYEAIADEILFDTKPPPNVSALPGGTGIAFDWRLLKSIRPARPWMLAGGLKAENLTEAVTESGATAVDVSSGVEDRPGVKSIERIQAFLAAAKAI